MHLPHPLPLTVLATKNSKLSQKNIGQNGLTKWSNIFSRLLKNILANVVRPFWPPQKLGDFTTVIMVWLNLPALPTFNYRLVKKKHQTTLAMADITLRNPREDTHTAASLRYDVRMMMSWIMLSPLVIQYWKRRQIQLHPNTSSSE